MRRCENPQCPDVILFGVVGEYSDASSHCPKCGEALAPVPLPAPETFVPEELGDDEPPIMGAFSYVATFRDWGPAQLARSTLVSHGYHADLLDQNFVALNWTHSQAVFGFKLVVSGTTGDEARGLLEENRSADLESIPEMSLPESPYDRCPVCASENIAWPRLARRCKALSMLVMWFVLMVPVASHFQPTRCRDCRHRWYPQWAA